jgi:chromosome segregation ATPase
MANKNKNIKALVSEGCNAESPALELIPTLTQPVQYPFSSSEAHEKTREFRDLAGNNARVVSDELTGSRFDHAKRIEELEFDLEQSQVRQRGLEKELEVREEITTSINEEVREARNQIVAAARELESLNNEYLSLKAAKDAAEQAAAQSKSSATRQEQQLAAKDEAIMGLERQLEEAAAELTDLRVYIDGRKNSWSDQEQELKLQQRELEKLRDENRELRSPPDRDREDEVLACRQQIAQQAGELASRALEIEGLRKDNEHFEEYSNELRIRLQDQTAAGSMAIAAQNELEAKLDKANTAISELTVRVAEEQAAVRQMAAEKVLLREELDGEMRQIRGDLKMARGRTAELESLNDQLVSDLVDSREFREALEQHVSDVEEKYKKRILRRRREAAGAKEALARAEREMRVKEATIANLMEELADQKRKISFTGELESALQKIDGFRTTNKGPEAAGNGERVTRQLIGSADGKELRFPLFRDRLTIGRTAHNDIQLGMRFVSRRHAVVATDGNKARIIDWGSRNGVYVNNRRVTEKILAAGDIITIGLANLRYEERAKR